MGDYSGLPKGLNQGIVLKSYRASKYGLRSIPSSRACGSSGYRPTNYLPVKRFEMLGVSTVPKPEPASSRCLGPSASVSGRSHEVVGIV